MLIELASVGASLNIAKTILGIGGLIFVHELGHFLVGRACKVRAEAFSIGFGPVLWKWKPGETEYRLSAIPLGGYVKFLGENPDERGELDPRSFHAATYPRKVAIMLAGVTMNVIAAFVLFMVTYASGWETSAPLVGQVQKGAPAWEHGIREGDEFVSIDGRRVLDFMDVRQETIFANEVEVVLRRDGKLLPPLRVATRDSGDGIRQIGILPASVEDGHIALDPNDPSGFAAEVGFESGDVVVSVDGKPVRTVDDALEVHKAAKKDTVWHLSRDGKELDVTLPWRTKEHARIGVLLSAVGDEIVVQRGGAAEAAGLRSGDRLVSIGGVPLAARQFGDLIGDAAVNGAFVVRRGEREISVPLPEGPAREAFASSVEVGGSGPVRAWLAEGDGPARSAGLPDGAQIRAIDEQPVTTIAEVQAAVRRAYDEKRAVTVHWRTPDVEHGTASVTPVDDPDVELGGIGSPIVNHVVKEDLPSAAALGIDRVGRWTSRIFGTLKSVLSGGVSGSKLSGPIMIARGTYSSARSSWGDFFIFLGMISMNLAVLNVLPLPLLDGGQLAVHTIEKLRGRPIPERVLEGVQWTGLVLLLALMVYVTRNDILHLMQS